MVQRITISNEQYQGISPRTSTGAWVLLTAEQVHYLSRVLRLKAGDRFIAQNGEGQQWLVAVGQSPEKSPVIEEIDHSLKLSSSPIRLIAALPKGNGFDEVVRQTTELGITHIYPVIAERTLLKPSDNKLARWRRIAREASEQSERVTVPHICAPMSFRQCVEHPPWEENTNGSPEAVKPVTENPGSHFLEGDYPKEASESTANKTVTTTELRPELQPKLQSELRYLCAARSADHNDHLLLADLLANLNHSGKNCSSEDIPSVILAIGPEGGWTSSEITLAIENGYKVVSLGSVILRAVTAPLTAVSLVTGARNLLI